MIHGLDKTLNYRLTSFNRRTGLDIYVEYFLPIYGAKLTSCMMGLLDKKLIIIKISSPFFVLLGGGGGVGGWWLKNIYKIMQTLLISLQQV